MTLIYMGLNLTAALLFLGAYGIHRVREKNKIRNGMGMPLAGPFRNLYVWLKGIGCYGKGEAVFYLTMPLIAIPLSSFAFFNRNVMQGIIFLVVPPAASAFLVAAKYKRIVSVFRKNAYKLYKYILNQTRAGIRPVDALRSMYIVVEDKILCKVLTEACAKYSVSLDAGVLAGDILEHLDTPESKSFAMSIRDGLFENRDESLMERLEQLMFNRYFAFVQRETDGVRTRCLVTVVILCSIIVVMILVPTVMDVQKAMNSIFTH